MALPIISYIGLSVFLLELIINGILFYTLSKRWKETRITAVALLSGAYLLFIIFIIVEFLFYLVNFEDPVGFYLKEGNVIVSLFPFFGGISAGFFMLFIDYFENERIDTIHGFVYGTFFGAFILNIMYQLILPEIFTLIQITELPTALEPNTLILLFLSFLFSTNFPLSYFVIYVIVVTLKSLVGIKRNITDEVQKKQVSLMQLTIIFYYFVTLIVVAGAYQLATLMDSVTLVFLRHIAPHITVIIGGIMIYKGYATAPVGFLQYQKIEKLMVINRSGLLLYSYDFESSDEDERSRDVLFSGGVVALLNLFSEMIHSKNIKVVQFQDKIIMLSHSENFVVFLVVDRITSFLWSALDSFSNMFNLKYGLDDQEYSVVQKNVFKDAELLLMIAFGRQ
ncbi:MAG: hypothetical protein ACXADY_20605 [Candidatus Hodarchaeales archaeon]|jgi:hypothetical protein